MPEKKDTKQNTETRPPIIVVMGHIDHGKSKLLDYIRKTNVVEGEAGGITQHLSAYRVVHETKEGEKKAITFLDTPGHAAFQKMRYRGADIADIAILIVSAEDGVMPQTLEALNCIKKAEIPYVVAINKIDKSAANIEKTKASLVENEIYIEGMGGDISWVPISAMTGEGVDDLLDLLLLTAELAELKTDRDALATGVIIEARLDGRRGNTASLMLKYGTLKAGQFVVAGTCYAPVRIMEDWLGKGIKEAHASEPVGIVGWNVVPRIGDPFVTVETKREAEKLAAEHKTETKQSVIEESAVPIIPLLVKADVSGTIDAIVHELEKFKSDRVRVRVIGTGVGNISVNDVQSVSATENAIIVGFNVKPDRAASDLAERLDVEIETFDIIYKLSEWLEEALKERTPKMETENVTGSAKILKHFSTQKNIQVLGGRHKEGTISHGQRVRIMRRDEEIGKGVIKNLQQEKSDVKSITEGEFGMQIETKTEVSAGDTIEAFDIEIT